MKVTRILALLLTCVLILSLASCGMKSYSRLGLSFEIPAGYEEKAIAHVDMAYGDDTSFIVFNKYTSSELSLIGVSATDVKAYTEYFLEKSEIGVEDVTYSSDGARATFEYVVGDPENTDVYYYYSVLILRGADCIWAVQMACYADLMYDYASEFETWARNIRAN